MAKGMRAIVAAAALGMGLFGAAGAARADTYDFTVQQNSFAGGGTTILSQGSFTAEQDPGSFLTVSSVSGYFLAGGGMVPISSYSDFIVSPQNDSFTFNGSYHNADYSFIFQSGTLTSNFYSVIANSSSAVSSYNNGQYKSSGYATTSSSDTATIQTPDGPITAAPTSTGSPSNLFAELVAPTTSAPSSPSSGSAPSPEVNTLLGFLVVGSTVAFLKRRRKGGRAEEMVAA